MTNIMLSNLPDYQHNIEKPFLGFLLEQGASHITRKNYRTDMQKFMNWLVSAYRIQSQPILALTYIQAVTPEVLERFKASQVNESIPHATINRRLSALRIFFTAAIVYKWRSTNPTTNMRNIPKKISPVIPAVELESITKIPDRASLVRDGRVDVVKSEYQTDDIVRPQAQMPKKLEKMPNQAQIATQTMCRFLENTHEKKSDTTPPPSKFSPLATIGITAMFVLAFVGSGFLVRQLLEMRSQEDYQFSAQSPTEPNVLGTEHQTNLDTTQPSKFEGKTFSAVEAPKTSAQSLISAIDESATASGLSTLGAFVTNDGLTVQFTKNTTLNSSLAVLGDTLLGPTSIAGTLAVGSTVHIGGEGIESFGDTLYVQKNKLGSIDFMSGAVSIDTLGKMIADTLQVKSLSTQDISIAGSLSMANAAKIGQSAILPGRRKVTVATSGITSQSTIFLTLTSSSGNQTPYVVDKQAGISFTVSVDDIANEEIRFNWWIIN